MNSVFNWPVVQWLLGPNAHRFSEALEYGVQFVAPYRAIWPLLTLLGLALAYLAIRSYRREGTVSPRVKGILAGIRIAVVALVIILILQPGYILRKTEEKKKEEKKKEPPPRSYLVVLIDDSLSMSFTDNYSGKQADGLRTLLSPPRAKGPDGAPATTAPSGRTDSPPPGPIDEMSRKDIVQRLLIRKGGALANLARRHSLIVMRFSTAHAGVKDRTGDYTTELGSIELPVDAEGKGPDGRDDTIIKIDANALPPPGLAEVLDGLTATGHVTDIGLAVHDALTHVQGRRVAGLVVISDGQITGESRRMTDRLAGAKRLAAHHKVDMYTVCVGDPTPPKRLTVTSVGGPDRIRPRSGVEFAALITHHGFSGRTVTVRLMRRPADVDRWTYTGKPKDITLKGTERRDGTEANRGSVRVALQLSPEETGALPLGRLVFKAVVTSLEEEADKSDNWAETSPVLVTDKRVHILLVSGDAGWEFQFLRNYLLRTPDMYRLSVWQQNADKDINQAASTGMKLARLPDSLGKLIGTGGGTSHPGYDLVILYDPKPGVEGFDEKFLGYLQTYVQVHGKGLCYIAGNKYTDHLLGKDNLAKLMLKMLPVKMSANTFSAVVRIENKRAEPWQVRPTSDGLRHQLTRLGDSPESTRDAWDVLPGMFWTHPVAKAKRSAHVLLENTNPSRRTVDNKPEPVLATHPYGKGRVVYVGMDATWRWRCVDDATHHRRFWGNMVEYLAISSARNMVISTGGTRFSTDKRITVEVEAYDPKNDYKPLDAEVFILLMDRADGKDKTVEIKLDPVANKPGMFRATIDAPPAGTYDLVPKEDLGANGGAGSNRAIKRITITPQQIEREHRQADPRTMMTLAPRLDNFIPIHEIDMLAERIKQVELARRKKLAAIPKPAPPPPKVDKITKTLWDCRLSLLLVVVMLTVEWILRKRYNMA